MLATKCPACFEHGDALKDGRHNTAKSRTACAAYTRQRKWNASMRRLLAEPGASWLHVPDAPDYSPKALRKWAMSQSVALGRDPNLWWRETWALLQKEPKSWRGFTFAPKGPVT